MSQKLTKQHLDKYLKNPEACPFCDSDNLKAGSASFIESICSRDITCLSCKEEFIEEFIMVGISQADTVLIINQDSFLTEAELIYYYGYTNNS